MRYPFDSPQAEELNKKIFETIYFGALTASCELAAKYGPYDTYQGSPVSQGVSLSLGHYNHLIAFGTPASDFAISGHGITFSLALFRLFSIF